MFGCKWMKKKKEKEKKEEEWIKGKLNDKEMKKKKKVSFVYVWK